MQAASLKPQNSRTHYIVLYFACSYSDTLEQLTPQVLYLKYLFKNTLNLRILLISLPKDQSIKLTSKACLILFKCSKVILSSSLKQEKTSCQQETKLPLLPLNLSAVTQNISFALYYSNSTQINLSQRKTKANTYIRIYMCTCIQLHQIKCTTCTCAAFIYLSLALNFSSSIYPNPSFC